MGNCFFRSTINQDDDFSIHSNYQEHKFVYCTICFQPISHVNYIHCLSCGRIVHLNCFKVVSQSMLECHICGSENLKVRRLRRKTFTTD